jgi:hypothetical protein
MVDDNIVLDMPFDESEGSLAAYDYSINRADGEVVDSNFVSGGGRPGNCIEFDGRGFCRVSEDVISVAGGFTLFAWLRRGEWPDGFSGKQVGLFVVWDDVGGYADFWFDVSDAWRHIAIVKKMLEVRLYLDGQLAWTFSLPEQLTGIAVLQDIYSVEYGYGFVADVKAFDVALTQDEIRRALGFSPELVYRLNGVDLREYGIYVSESNGLFDRPKQKSPFKLDWPGYHGQVVDLTGKRVESREIELKCWIKAEGRMDFVDRLNRFLDVFARDGTQRLMVDVHPKKPLLYEVYNEAGISVSKQWREGIMTGTFTLKLIEPEPVKRVVRYRRNGDAEKTLTVALTSDKIVMIYWGDGQKNEVFGDVSVSHDYANDGIFWAVIAGVVEDITGFETNGIVVWNKI